MAKYKVELNRNDCISCGSCQSINPGLFLMSKEDGKIDLKGGSPVEGKEEWVKVELDDENLDKNKQAESECPANVIHITDSGGE